MLVESNQQKLNPTQKQINNNLVAGMEIKYQKRRKRLKNQNYDEFIYKIS